MRSPSLIFTLFLLLLGTTHAQTADLKQVADAVDHRYNRLSTFKSDFVETYSGNGISRKESGTLLLKKPGKMLWDYAEPHRKVFVTDGKSAFFYVPGEMQARKAPLKKLDDLRSPLRYLLGNTKLQKEFNGLKLTSSQGNTEVLEGVPKGMEERVSDVQLTIQNSQIAAIRIQLLDGSVTEFEFSNVQENVPVPEAKFRPDVPAGVHWIEGEDLSPE